MKIILDFAEAVSMEKTMRVLHTYGLVEKFVVDEEAYLYLEDKFKKFIDSIGADIVPDQTAKMTFRGTPVERAV
jgi:hypothetical protein